MPYPNAKKVLIWPSECKIDTFSNQTVIKTDIDENCFIQLVAGKCTAIYGDRTYSLAASSILALGRSTSVILDCTDNQICQYLVFCYRSVLSPRNIDLNHLCLQVALIDSFFGRKTRFCILTDREYIHVTLNALLYEWENKMQERDIMISLLMKELFIKLARSFHAHYRPNGMQILSCARTYIQQNFQLPITLDEIASHAGISRSYLTSLFSRHMNRSVVEHIQAIRCDKAAFLLSSTHFSVIDIAMDTGFTNRQHFTRVFGKVYGMSPQEYRRAHHISHQLNQPTKQGRDEGNS